MRILIIIISTFVFTIIQQDGYSQNVNREELVEIAGQGLLENSTIKNTTFNLNGENYVFFEAFHEWVGTEYMQEGEKNGTEYKIWLPKHLFFYSIDFYIVIYDMKLDNDKLIV